MVVFILTTINSALQNAYSPVSNIGKIIGKLNVVISGGKLSIKRRGWTSEEKAEFVQASYTVSPCAFHQIMV